jgi:ribosomal protein S18 acetylase RimI-like enzyme
MKPVKINFRENVVPADIIIVGDIVKSTGFFNHEEVEIAVELVEERLAKGEWSGYHFLFAEINGKAAAYSCYGPIHGTQSSYDLYWIVTHTDFRGQGIGKLLLAETEHRIAQAGGKGIYAETASKPQYEPTRIFYDNCGYTLEARLKQFYADDDDKLFYVKRV